MNNVGRHAGVSDLGQDADRNRGFLTIVKFGIVGGGATIIHMICVAVFLEASLPPLVANAGAFLLAFIFSFSGHYLWTFGSPGAPTRAARRFLFSSALAFGANNLILIALLLLNWMSTLSSAIVSIAAIPFISYLAARYWAFKKI